MKLCQIKFNVVHRYMELYQIMLIVISWYWIKSNKVHHSYLYGTIPNKVHHSSSIWNYMSNNINCD